jgi:hypothetical protein
VVVATENNSQRRRRRHRFLKLTENCHDFCHLNTSLWSVLENALTLGTMFFARHSFFCKFAFSRLWNSSKDGRRRRRRHRRHVDRAPQWAANKPVSVRARGAVRVARGEWSALTFTLFWLISSWYFAQSKSLSTLPSQFTQV